MKPDSRVVDVDSTVTGERIAMTLDMDSLPFLVNIMTDLYSDPELAIIREYSTNALDSHVEAGITRPIEITLPTSLAPQFRVRDYGVGLNAEDIREMYSKYGASSKRDSDDVVGMLGLGSKSALTYTNQFTFTGYKNGIATVTIVSRDENGTPSMTVVDEFVTEETGVEISVPVKSNNNFADKAANFFRFWKPGTVLVNGEEPKRVGGLWVADDLLLTEEVSESMIVMGNVAYPVPYEGYSYNRNRYVAYVEIGEVSFTPSREALQMNRKTKDKIEEIKARVQAERNAALAKQVNEAPNRWEAVKLSLQAKRFGYNGAPLTYKGEEFPGDLISPTGESSYLYVDGHKPYNRKGWAIERAFSASFWSTMNFLVGHTADSFSPTKRAKLEQWAEQNNVSLNLNFILVENLPKQHRKWIDPKKIYKWSDVAAQKIKIERTAARRDGRPTGSYEGYVDGQYQRVLQAEEIDASKPIFYVNKTVRHVSNYQLAVLNEHYPKGYTVVIMSQNRIAKFQRDFPTATKDVYATVIEHAMNWVKSLTDGDKLAIALQNDRDASFLRRLEADRIDDPTLSGTVATLKSDRLKKINQKMSLYVNVYNMSFSRYTNGSPLESYPLLTALNSYATIDEERLEHLYIYVNAAFAARKEQ